MDPTTLPRTVRFSRCLGAAFVLAFAAHCFAGVVQIGGSISTSHVAPSTGDARVSDPALQHTDFLSGNVQAVDTVAVADQGQSPWLTLLDDSNSAGHDDSHEAKNGPTQSADLDHAINAAPGAVIPLPSAVYPAFLTLCGAGWVAVRSRSGRRL